VADFTGETFSADGCAGTNCDDAIAWITGPRSDKNIVRDPATGLIARVKTGRINAQQMEVASWDFYGRCNLP
jgi:hypothetical protein